MSGDPGVFSWTSDESVVDLTGSQDRLPGLLDQNLAGCLPTCAKNH